MGGNEPTFWAAVMGEIVLYALAGLGAVVLVLILAWLVMYYFI